MKQMRTAILFLLAATIIAGAQTMPDRETARWWANTQYLASDAMEGRDTGSAAYQRAAEWVALQFKQAGLKPAGVNGYMQPVPMHQVALDTTRSSVVLRWDSPIDVSTVEPLRLLYDITVTPGAGANAHLNVPLVFAGYGTADELHGFDVKGKGVVVFGGAPKSLQPQAVAAERARLLANAGAFALITIANPRAIEPARWPVAYARSVRLRDNPAPPSQPQLFTLRADIAAHLFGTCRDCVFKQVENPDVWKEILEKGNAGEPLPLFFIPAHLIADLHFDEKDIESPNVVGVLPGSDPSLKNEYVAISAHLDGYGYGEPINGDNLYNGALDDAAYVSTLIEFARLAQEQHKTYRRSILLAAFTGEEKGLLGSAYFTKHPTVSREQLVADINLDQLRPIFPLRILTVEGLDDSTLGDATRDVAQNMNIEVRRDLEPQRNLFRRADNYNFVRLGVPAIGFVFGYNPGSPEEKIYRAWYAERYHHPSDDVSQPVDFTAAARMNTFIYSLAAALANADSKPAWNPNSPYKPKPGSTSSDRE
jgi:hypothetical protein